MDPKDLRDLIPKWLWTKFNDEEELKLVPDWLASLDEGIRQKLVFLVWNEAKFPISNADHDFIKAEVKIVKQTNFSCE